MTVQCSVQSEAIYHTREQNRAKESTASVSLQVGLCVCIKETIQQNSAENYPQCSQSAETGLASEVCFFSFVEQQF